MLRTAAMYWIKEEYYKVEKEFPSFHTNHEGKAIIEEELDELWDEIKKLPPTGWSEEMTEEAIHLGAMVLRFLIDRC